MSGVSRCGFLSLAILVLTAFASPSSQRGLRIDENGVKTETFLSPKFELEPGSVCNKFLHNINFPTGHIAIKRFDAEVVDEAGHPVPLHETYMHHWIIVRYYKPLGDRSNDTSAYKLVRNAGVCDELGQYFGLGSETRKSDTHVPDPYGIEVGNAPEGYEDGWMVNIHAIDTRGVVDKLRCTECRCDLYNVTVDEYGEPIDPDYAGGLRCCYDGVRCRLKDGYKGAKKGYYLKYTVTYVDWNPSIVPVKIYIFDVTDILEMREPVHRHHCMVDYYVERCSSTVANDDECIHIKTLNVSLPSGGDLIYAIAHQHTAAIGSTLFGEDGRVLCTSVPIYGEGEEPGNESGYIVGMTACYPQPGSVKIRADETLRIASNYSNVESHTGVMGFFYILVAEPLPQPYSIMQPLDEK